MSHIMKRKDNLPLDRKICIGNGLVALDVVISSDELNTQFFAGGSCGNVMAILSFLGWDSFPIARLSNNVAAEVLIEDLSKWNVREELITKSNDGSTPIIIHRILRDKQGLPKHRFEFRNPEDGSYLPSYKPCLAKSVHAITGKVPSCSLFYFDRINRGSIDLAKAYKGNGAVIFFEPSSLKDLKGFTECLEVADIVKFSHDRISNYNEVFPKGQTFLEIQTLGDKGLCFRKKGKVKWHQLNSYSINNVIDSAGAGDWCTAGIIQSIFAEKLPFKKLSEDAIIAAIRYGQLLSALNCTFEGARGMMYNLSLEQITAKVNGALAMDGKGEKLEIIITNSNKLRKSDNIKISSLFASK